MGAINFNPAQVIKKLSTDCGEEISRLAALAGGQPRNQPVGHPPAAENSDGCAANPANSRVLDSENSRVAIANPANLLNRDGPAEWREGFAALNANRPPINFPPSSWRGVIRDAELFLATWSKRAEDFGWDSLSLFGAHRRVPDARYSHKGLLMMIGGGRVVALTTASAVIEQQSGARLTYTRRLAEAECVQLWNLPGAV